MTEGARFHDRHEVRVFDGDDGPELQLVKVEQTYQHGEITQRETVVRRFALTEIEEVARWA